jgi:uncharacterized protein YndB with AHSA1/START domain
MTTAHTVSDTSDREIIITREFDAPRELVWEAITNPKHVVNWWGPRGFSTTIEHMDFRPGGTWKQVMHGPDGTNYPNQSVFKEIVKPERIVYAHGGGKEGGKDLHFTMTWTLDTIAPGKTRVTIHQVYATAEDCNFVAKEYGAIEGGKQTLERLAEFLAEMQK